MSSIPQAARLVLDALAPAFTRPTFARFGVLVLASLLTVGPRTVSNLLRTVGRLAPGHPSSYRRVLSRRRWRSWRLARILAGLVLARVPAGQPVRLVGDDTVEEHRGKHVHGKARHRDPVRSTHGYTTWRWGHRWVGLAVLVEVPLAAWPWALPVLVALYRSKEGNARLGRRHKTPAELMRQLLLVLIRRFPEKTFVFAGDAAFSTHASAVFAAAHGDRLTQVGKFYPHAALHKLPPKMRGKRKGRPRVKGERLPTPEQVVAQTRRKRIRTVSWYGGTRRVVALVTGTGYWYKAGEGLVAVRWVHVEDRSGTHRPEYFFSTDPTMRPERIVELYTGRWNIETTFEELRACLGWSTTRGRCRNTVLRHAPGLLGLYSVVVLIYLRLTPAQRQKGWRGWERKDHVTFSDAVAAVRRHLWQEWVFQSLAPARPLQKLPRHFQELLLQALTPAA